jgi:hypothetical protein
VIDPSMSVTDPRTSRLSPAVPASPPEPSAPQRWDHRLTYALLALGALVVVAVFVVFQTYPNYDTYYTLVWGKELAHWQLPDYDVLRTPTPHPLATLVGWLMAPFGTASDRILVLASLFGLLGFYVATFVFCERLLGRPIALIAVVVMLTRTDMQLLALRAMFDLPFYLLVFGAAVLELRRPRCGWPVLVVLALAGLLRPEAWLLAGAYWLWLAPPASLRSSSAGGSAPSLAPRPHLIRYALLVVAAPLVWMACDLIVTGEPLYSLTSTREVSGEFGRNRGLLDAIAHIPEYSGGNDRSVTVGVGGLGMLLAIYILRRRAALPLALGGLGVLTFLIIAAAGLSVIPRYMTIPSLLLSLCVAVAVGGWTLVEGRTPRRVAIGIAVVSALVLCWRAPYYYRDFSKLADQANFIEAQHKGLKGILDAPRVVPALQRCRPITVPTHSAIPVIRYETGLPKEAIEASIAQRRPPRAGLLLIGRTFNFEPGAGRANTSSNARASARKRWSNKPLRGFVRIGRSGRWKALARCS